MASYEEVTIKLKNAELNELKPATKNQTGTQYWE